MGRRRMWGSGSLFQRKSDGRWIGSLPDGRGGRRYVTGTDKATVSKRLREMVRTTSSPQSTESLGAFLDRWLRDVAPKRVRPRTLASYRSLVVHHIDPDLGSIRLSDLQPADVQAFTNSIVASGLSPQTARHAHKVLRVALNQALRWGEVNRNVATLVDAPRVPRGEMRRLTEEQSVGFLLSHREHPHHAIWVLAATTGMRQGEILSLRWKDIDLRRGTVRIEQTLLEWKPGHWKEQEPKTARSRRVLPIGLLAVESLTRQKANTTSAIFVFARADGQPLARSWVTAVFQRELVAAGLPSVSFHSLRHTASESMLNASGGDLRQVMAMLGHSTIATTVDRYGGIAEAAKKSVAEAMDRIYSDKSADNAAN